jgi:hypothetical protein
MKDRFDSKPNAWFFLLLQANRSIEHKSGGNSLLQRGYDENSKVITLELLIVNLTT